jgi:hypothetical protein
MNRAAFKKKKLMMRTRRLCIIYISTKTAVSGNSLLYAGVTLITRLVRHRKSCTLPTLTPFCWRKKGHSYIIHTFFVLRDCTIRLSRVIVTHHITIIYNIIYYGCTGSDEFFPCIYIQRLLIKYITILVIRLLYTSEDNRVP